MSADFTPPSVVYGIVYGGDRPRAKTWLTRGVVTDGTLSIDRCAPVDEWFDGTEMPIEAPTLTTFLAELPPTAAAGLDFPFGLPERIVIEENWGAFLREFPSWCTSPDDLRRQCERRVRLVDGSSETRLRATDEPLSAMSPFDESIVAATYHGVRDVLRPLVLSDSVRVPPMTPAHPDCPSVIEVYPAGTLVDLNVFTAGYEAPGDDGRELRSETLDGLVDAVDVELTIDDDVREACVEDAARLESLVAAHAVYRNSRSASALTVSDSQRLVEGQVFV